MSGNAGIAYTKNPLRTRYGIYGLTAKALTEWVGSTMSSAAKWLKAAKSFEITGANILLSVLAVGFLAFLATKIAETRVATIYMEGHTFVHAGFAQQDINGQKVLFPFYQEVGK